MDRTHLLLRNPALSFGNENSQRLLRPAREGQNAHSDPNDDPHNPDDTDLNKEKPSNYRQAWVSQPLLYPYLHLPWTFLQYFDKPSLEPYYVPCPGHYQAPLTITYPLPISET